MVADSAEDTWAASAAAELTWEVAEEPTWLVVAEAATAEVVAVDTVKRLTVQNNSADTGLYRLFHVQVCQRKMKITPFR